MTILSKSNIPLDIRKNTYLRARIGLLPDGIAGKRMFSKKYPIEIRPNCVSAPDTLDSDREHDVSKPNYAHGHAHTHAHAHKEDAEFHSLDSPCSTKDDTEKDIDELEDEPQIENVDIDEKVFYLFARADRYIQLYYSSNCNNEAFREKVCNMVIIKRKEKRLSESIHPY